VQLTKLVRGDLDWIVMKALEKDRNRRYDTANGLALDLHRHLHDEPVLARPPSTSYRLRKFTRKHKTSHGGGGRLCRLTYGCNRGEFSVGALGQQGEDPGC